MGFMRGSCTTEESPRRVFRLKIMSDLRLMLRHGRSGFLPGFRVILLMDKILQTLRTLNYGNYGIFLITGNAGFCPSTVALGLRVYIVIVG